MDIALTYNNQEKVYLLSTKLVCSCTRVPATIIQCQAIEGEYPALSRCLCHHRDIVEIPCYAFSCGTFQDHRLTDTCIDNAAVLRC